MRKILWLISVLISAFSLYGQNPSQSGAAIDYLNVYQKYISPIKHTNCRMYPSCSAYAKMVFSSHAFPMAMVLTSDRLIRCGHDLELYQKTHIGEFTRAVDYPDGMEIPDGIVIREPSNISAERYPIKDSTDYRIAFVHHLINEGNYYGALTEIERLQFYSYDIYSKIPVLYVDKLKCYEGLRDYSKAILTYHSYPEWIKSDYKTVYTYSHLLDLSGDMQGAIREYEHAATLLPDGESVCPYGELAVLYMRNKNLSSARESIEKKYSIDGRFDAYKASRQVIEDACNAHYKNARLAMALSVIPGGGYFYTESIASGFTALILNALLTYATYTSFKSGNYGIGTIVGALNLSFYVGNMVGAGRNARRYNDSIDRKSVDKLRKLNPYIN